MKAIVVYYSYTGFTKQLAESLAKKESHDILELKDSKRPSKVGAYVVGSLRARAGKPAKLQTFHDNFSNYDTIIIAMPVWAQAPAPSFNNILSILPSGKQVEIIMTSGSGSSGNTQESVKAVLEKKGCKLIKFTDVKAESNG